MKKIRTVIKEFAFNKSYLGITKANIGDKIEIIKHIKNPYGINGKNYYCQLRKNNNPISLAYHYKDTIESFTE